MRHPNMTHGETGKTKEYRAWQSMIRRCTNPNVPQYKDYGGRGIVVCDRWRSSYETFLFDMGRAPTAKHTVDRRDNMGNYEPDNCRWATYKEQRRNTRQVRTVVVDGVSMCLKDACALRGVSYKLAHKRINAMGWSAEEAISRPKMTTWKRHQPHAVAT